jgi:DMSO/TMAO reductase YedYZ molybdopterin-dependent catalytic subunit
VDRRPTLDRRQVLYLGAATFGSRLLPACDNLVLPDFPTGQATSPITPTNEFYTQSCCGTPDVDVSAWRLRILGLGEPLAELDAAFLDTLTPRTKEHTLQCIGGGPGSQQISNALWGGLPLRELLDLLGVQVPATAIAQKWTCADDYHTGLPIEDLDTMWAVWLLNDRPLPPAHGAPLRLLTPGRYGTKNPKWPIELDLVDTPHTGFWEARGWSDEAFYKANGFIVAPRDQTSVMVGPVEIRGTAFAGDDPIARVEVTTNGGESWREATLTYQGGPDIWTLWSIDWDPEEPGSYAVQVRVTTESGAMSSPSPDATNRLEGYDGSMQIEVQVV